MTYPIEDEAPCIHHRSKFDTIPAPPPIFGVQPDGSYVTRIHAPVSEPEFAELAYITPTPENTHILKDPVFILSRCGREKLTIAAMNAAGVLPKPETVEAAKERLSRKPSEPTMLSTVALTERVSANGRAAFLEFAGGEVELPKPTRADLVLSAQQWATRLREDAIDRNACDSRTRGYFDRLDAILKELAES
ncbi:MAG: hypothetical protein V4739_17480 [Pseudomonadota bacterium]